MKFLASVFAVAIFTFASNVVHPQTSKTTEAVESKEREKLQAARLGQSKADILADINSLKSKDQMVYYAMLGDLLWEHDRAEAEISLNKAAEIALDPATEYRDTADKLDYLRRFFYAGGAAGKNEALANKLRSAAAEVFFQASKTPRADEYRRKFLDFAQLLVRSDKNLAFELAMLSLDGKNPVLYPDAVNFFFYLRSVDETFADRYLSKVVEIFRKNGDKASLGSTIEYLNDYASNNRSAPVSDAQKSLLYAVLIPHIESETRELLRKTATDCYLTRTYGKPLLADFKRLLSAQAAVVEQALKVCQTANIEDWYKPEPKGAVKTSQEALDAAAAPTDPTLRRHFTFRAAVLARDEKNFLRAHEILDSMDDAQKTWLSQNWDLFRIGVTVDQIRELYGKKDFAGARKTLENSLPRLRPYVYLNILSESGGWWLSDSQTNLLLLDLAREEFKKADFPLPKFNYLITTNPAKFQALVYWCVRNKFTAEALAVFDEYVELMNRLTSKYTFKTDAGDTFSHFYYYPLPQKFVDENFERLSESTRRLESSKARLEIRLWLLHDLLGARRWNVRHSPIKMS